jgi:hypothetical protein
VLLARRRDRDAATSLGPAIGQNLAAARRLHAGAEAVGTATLDIMRLVSALHDKNSRRGGSTIRGASPVESGAGYRDLSTQATLALP